MFWHLCQTGQSPGVTNDVQTHRTHPPSPVRAQHQHRSLYKHWRAGSCFWQPRLHKIMPLDNPKFPKSQFPRQITSWLPSRNPQLPRTGAAACTAISPAAVQLTIWWEKKGKKHCSEARMLQLVFSLITEHSRPLPKLQSLLELQSLQHRKNKLSLLFVLVRIS